MPKGPAVLPDSQGQVGWQAEGRARAAAPREGSPEGWGSEPGVLGVHGPVMLSLLDPAIPSGLASGLPERQHSEFKTLETLGAFP